MKVDTDMLLKIMKEQKITQTSVAEKLGVTIVTLNRKLHGIVPITAEELSEILGLLGFELVGLSGEKVGRILKLIKEENNGREIECDEYGNSTDIHG